MNKAKELGFNEEFCKIYDFVLEDIMEKHNCDKAKAEKMVEEGLNFVEKIGFGFTEREKMVFFVSKLLDKILGGI